MIDYLIRLFKALFNLRNKPTKKLGELTEQLAEKKQKLREIDNENLSDDDIDSYLNE